MVQPENIRRKAERIYGEFLRAWIVDGATDFFPRLVPSERGMGNDVAEAARLVQSLRASSKQIVGHGYSVEWREVSSRLLGRNLFPQRVTFDTREDLIRFVGRDREFHAFSCAVERLRKEFPALSSWVRCNVRTIPAIAGDLDGLLAVLEYFFRNPCPGCFARELPVPVDTKFIERNKQILQQWFDLLLPAHTIRADEDQFELRYGLRYVEPEIFLRFLDSDVQKELGFSVNAMSLPIHSLGRLPIREVNVIIVENKVNVLTMPMRPRSLVIGGLGNACTLLRHVAWLSALPITYWGDIDIEGLEILSRLRKLFPQVRSVMMDDQAIQRWRRLVGPGTGRSLELPPLLTAGEAAAFRTCAEQNLRLEQERIPQVDVLAMFG